MLNREPILLLIFIVSIVLSCKNDSSTRIKNAENEASATVLKITANEKHRPKFHFSPPEKWMNDPNGMVYYEGEYHLFYQYYPDSTVWGPMHWGHAVSKDLVEWEHLPIALYPDELGYIFSGSAVIDWENTSGFGTKDNPPMIAIFTHHNAEGARSGSKKFQYQSIAYSLDKGRTFTKYKGNPVVKNPGIKDFRDPKVIWDAEPEQWVMVFAAWDHVKLYGSKNLKDWTFLSDFGKEWGTHAGVWECPDLFPMIVKGRGEKKWVLLQSLNPGGPNGGSGTQYFVGDFDGKEFKLDPTFAKRLQRDSAVWLDFGQDNYAGVTWSDIPVSDGRRLFMGWMSNWDYAQSVPTETWRSAMTIARNLVLKRTYRGLEVFSEPVREMQALVKTTEKIELGKDASPIKREEGIIGKVSLVFQLKSKSKPKVKLVLSNSKKEQYIVGYDAPTNQFFSDRTNAGKQAFSGKFASNIHFAPRYSNSSLIEMVIYLDVASAELFADKGWNVMTDIFFPNEDFNQMQLVVEDGEIDLKEGKVDWF